MAKVKSNYQGVNGVYYIVNPKGAIHTCDRNHSVSRLRLVGWRLAEDSEIEVYNETSVQKHDKPICERWSPEPEVLPDVPEAQNEQQAEATESALAFAKEHNLDLKQVKGTGAGGRILLKDVEALVK